MTDDRDDQDKNNVTPLRPREGNGEMRILRVANDSQPSAGEPAIKLPPTVKALCALLLTVGIVQFFLPPDLNRALIETFGFVPLRYSMMETDIGFFLSPVTHMLIHGGMLHLMINLGMLMAFGSATEKTIGGKRMVVLAALSGLVGALFHFIVFPDSPSPLIGISGAVSGLFGAMMMAMYYAGQMGARGWRSLLPFILVWVVISLLFGFFGMPGAGGSIAWTVHIAGFIAGIFLFKPLVPLMK